MREFHYQHQKSPQFEEHFYINASPVQESESLFHLHMFLDSQWNFYQCFPASPRKECAFLALVTEGVQIRYTPLGIQKLTPGTLLVERLQEKCIRSESSSREPLCRLALEITRTPAFDALTQVLFPEPTLIFACKDPEKVKSRFSAIKEVILQGGTEFQLSGRIFALLQEIAFQRKEESMPGPLSKALKFLQNFGYGQLARRQWAKAAGVSERTLTELFRKHFGTSPGRYLAARRLEYGALLLESGRFTVGEAAENAGFNSSEYFIREFRKQFGTSPGKYEALPPGGKD